MSQLVEIHEPGASPRQLVVQGRLEVGRECNGLVVDDPAVSRRHLVLEAGSEGLVVEDLGSRNGTTVNRGAVSGPVLLADGDVIGLGDIEIVVLPTDARIPRPDTPQFETPRPETPRSETPRPDTPRPDTPRSDTPEAEMPPAPPRPRPRLDELQARPTDGAVLRFRPGTAGERAAAGMAAQVRRAGRRLSGLGPGLRSISPQICLVDPFPDPSHPGQTVTAGSVVDAARREIWMAVTAEAPPDRPERPLALLLGAGLPAGPELSLLLEGYGQAVSDAPDPSDELRTMDLPSLDAAEGEVRTAMAQSFVQFLLARGGRDEFLHVLQNVPPGGLDAAFHEAYGQGLAALEESWREEIGTPPPKVKTGQFLRLTVRYLRPHARREAEIGIYMLFSLAFTTVFPFVMRSLLDTAIPDGDLTQALQLVGVLGLAFLVSLLAGLRRAYLSAFVSSAITRDVRVEMFGRLQSLSAGWFGRQQEGDILSRLFSDVAQMEQGVSQTIREGIFQALTVIVSAVVLLTLDPLLGVIVIIGAPLVAVVYRAMAAGAQKRSLAVQEELGTTYTVASENYGAQAVVKAFGLEQREQDRFTRASQRLFRREVRLQLFGGMFGLSVNLIMTLLQLVILALGSWLILNGHLTIGGLVAFTTTMGQVLAPVTALTGIGQQIQASTGSLVRINSVIEATPDVADHEDALDLPPLQREIRLQDVGFSFTPERRTLADVNCAIPAGSRVAFVGPTGAGKSSVLSLIMRFYDVDEGAVLFDGHDLRQATVSSVRRQLGVVFQDTFLFDTTIRENIAMAQPDASDADIERAARAAELHDFVETLPRGYQTLVGERGGRLSGGQRQRVAIARALLRDPQVLLLDEATSALDPRTERMISDTLDRVGQGRTVIAVTHRLTSIARYDRIFVMADGRLVEQGTHDELLARRGVYAELWAEQTGGIAPVEAPFDAVAALSAVQIFSGLTSDELGSAAARLRSLDLRAGERLPETEGTLVFVRRGRPRVLSPGLDGRLVPAAELGPGDAFGISALLGEQSGLVLVAEEAVGLLVLDADALATLAAIHPSVADSLTGEGSRSPAPRGGERLSRPSLVLRAGGRLDGVGRRAEQPGPDDLRRMSGAFGAVPS